MRLAAGGVPVVVKCRAIELVNKVKILPVYNDYDELWKFILDIARD
jgi:hypothetical protein